MQRHGLAAPVFLGLAVLMGCGDKPAPSPAAAPSTATAAATATAVAAATVSATASAAAAPAEDPIFAALKGKPQKDDTKPSETVRDGGGVFLGLPKGWTTYDTNKIDPEFGYGANHGGCLELSPPKDTAAFRTDPHARLCAVVLDKLPAATGRSVASLEIYGYYLSFDTKEWTPWIDGTVGDGLKAKLSRGALKGKDAFAAYVDVPGRKSILVVGRWANDEEKEAVFEMVRGIGSCTFSADKRKCTPDKPYR
ncbi:MAG: hypothetical protein IT372_05075 [Polyangiaceae bacterium]|nr:hypothetical protein [Polyangiaceae bacterium]